MARKQIDLTPIGFVFLPFDQFILVPRNGESIFTISHGENFSAAFLAKNNYTGYFLEYGTWCEARLVDKQKVIFHGRFCFRLIKKIKESPTLIKALVDIKENEESPLFVELARRISFNKKVYERSLVAMDKIRSRFSTFPPNETLLPMKTGDLAFLFGSLLPCDFFAQRQDIIQTSNPVVRLDKALSYLEFFISDKNAVNIPVRSFKEGGKDKMQEREDVAIFRKKLADLSDRISSQVKVAIEKRVESLSKTSPSSSAYQFIYDWLSFALDFYALKKTSDNNDIKNVCEILEADHCGLAKAKERIIEEIAVRKLNPNKKGPTLLFVGPPGTGKTSLGASIARALGRKFVRLSLGGVKDEALIRGHSMTYVGAKPGRILENILRSGSSNPVIMLDEVDKLGREGLNGNVESALLEVFDPEQNFAFEDHYLGLPADLSEVIFITTANEDDDIPPALLDRMDVINFPGYCFEEKLDIAKTFLIPRQIERNGLAGVAGMEKLSLIFTDDLLAEIIDSYIFETGVRELERNIAGILRKIAKSHCLDSSRACEVTPVSLRNFLGARLPTGFLSEACPTPVGVIWAVSVTSKGGMLLRVEAAIVNRNGSGELTLTGSLGDQLKETAEVAFKYLRSHIRTGKDVKMSNDVHVHIAPFVTKDGSSAGVALASALYSCYKNKSAKIGMVMTGEMNFSGEVLAVGGVREKIMAAAKAGAKEFIMPEANRGDLLSVPESALNRLKIHLVKTIDDVWCIAFGRRKKRIKKTKIIR